MRIDDRDKIDDLFRSKLYDFESEAPPKDIWDKIEVRLDRQRPALNPLYRKKWWAAAAAAIAFLIIGNVVYFLQKEPVSPVVVETIEQKTEELKSIIREQESALPIMDTELKPSVAQVKKSSSVPSVPTVRLLSASADTASDKHSGQVQEEEEIEEANVTAADQPVEDVAAKNEIAVSPEYTDRSALDNDPAEPVKKTKRWGMGMGAGSFSSGSSSVFNGYSFRNTTYEDQQLYFLNAVTDKFTDQSPKTDIKHRQPVSFGLSASYMLTPRWFLMGGLNYSYLSSEWKTNGGYYQKSEQRLHFIGLPVAIAYKIAEWNSFVWYASAGVMPEVNVAGTTKMTKYMNGQPLDNPEKIDQRMKEWYWSVNAATGISYPLLRFLSAYAEVGAGYYFDNGSTIETIHSDKPFNVNLSVGLRLGF